MLIRMLSTQAVAPDATGPYGGNAHAVWARDEQHECNAWLADLLIRAGFAVAIYPVASEPAAQPEPPELPVKRPRGRPRKVRA